MEPAEGVRPRWEHVFAMGRGHSGRIPGGEFAARARILAAPGMTSAEAHTWSGLLEAEAHFAVGPNNGGTTWSCSLKVALRDDDRDLLVALTETTGLGHLTEKPARAGSRPQVVWTASSKLECLVLAEILEDHPFLGRRRNEQALWTEAVRLWASDRYLSDTPAWRKLALLAHQLRAARRYQPPMSSEVAAMSLAEPGLRAHFSGFFSGEGCFLLPKEGGARISVKLRRDDRPLLEGFARTFGIGKVYDVAARPPDSPAAIWTVCSRSHLLKVIALFDSAPLLGRKADQYIPWRVGALELAHASLEGSKPDLARLDMARRGLAASKQYVPRSTPLDIGDRTVDARDAYVLILRRWASQTDELLSCARYARDRQPGWPNRNTIARFFGSWADALTAAGLESRLARIPARS
jgi:hypothetical protein